MSAMRLRAQEWQGGPGDIRAIVGKKISEAGKDAVSGFACRPMPVGHFFVSFDNAVPLLIRLRRRCSAFVDVSTCA